MLCDGFDCVCRLIAADQGTNETLNIILNSFGYGIDVRQFPKAKGMTF